MNDPTQKQITAWMARRDSSLRLKVAEAHVLIADLVDALHDATLPGPQLPAMRERVAALLARAEAAIIPPAHRRGDEH